MTENIAHLNGHVPRAELARLSWNPKHRVLSGKPHEQFEALNQAYRKVWGKDIEVRYSYRSYLHQILVRLLYSDRAAAAGTSMHGFGLALDLAGGIELFGTAPYHWMLLHAPEYGWDNPVWARRYGTNPEAWHWEYVG